MSSPFRPAGDQYDPRGFATGAFVTNMIEKEHDVVLQQWRWRYGTHFRAREFEPHTHLDGRFMTSMGTLDGYYPGDHKGCLCLVEPVFVRSNTREFIRVSVDA
jgi:hypothetical protein